MIAIKAMEMRDKFKRYCDKATSGEVIIVTRKNNDNVVVISEREYNTMMKAARNADYLTMIDKSMSELGKGGFISKSLDELRELEQ
ncbi:MAG: type II toxin-antitoxin system prevent-host-death family antitoxin [Veillonellales bacterium]